MIVIHFQVFVVCTMCLPYSFSPLFSVHLSTVGTRTRTMHKYVHHFQSHNHLGRDCNRHVSECLNVHCRLMQLQISFGCFGIWFWCSFISSTFIIIMKHLRHCLYNLCWGIYGSRGKKANSYYLKLLKSTSQHIGMCRWDDIGREKEKQTMSSKFNIWLRIHWFSLGQVLSVTYILFTVQFYMAN